MKQILARTALAALLLDLAIKLVPAQGSRVLLPSLLRFHPVRNQGVAFGLLRGHPLMMLTLTLLIVAIGVFWLRGLRLGRFEEAAAGLMLGGAAGNLIDRALHGGVTDYLELLFVRFPVFNLADVCLVLGAGLMALSLLLPGKAETA